MSQLLDKLKEDRQAVWLKLKKVADGAATENRAFTDYEQGVWDLDSARLDQYDERIAELSGTETRAKGVDDLFTSTRGYVRPGSIKTAADKELDDQFRSMLLEGNPKPIEVRSGNPRSYYQPAIEKRDLLTSAPANLSKVGFHDRIIEHLVESSAVLAAGATLVTTQTGEPLRVPRSTALSTAAITAEGQAIGESDPTLSVVTLGAFKYALLVQVSGEALNDSGVDLQAYLSRETGQAIGQALGNHLINGSGTGQPRGAILDATLGAAGTTGSATSFGSQGTVDQGTDALANLYGSLAEPYTRSPSTAFLMRTATLANIRKLKTATQGDPVGVNFIGPGPAGSQGSILNAPVYVDPFVPAQAANAKSVLFGDWSRYFVRFVNGVRFERSDDYAFGNDLVTFRAILRADGALVDNTGAVKWWSNSAA